jgi:hypothetical protein
MNGNFESTEETDQQCSHCGLWFSDRGIKAHEMHCPFAGREERILASVERGGAPEDGATPDETEPTDGVGDTPTPETATDGGARGLGLEGPPEPSTSSNDPSPESATEPDQDGADDDGGCPECGTALEDVPAGKTFVLENGQQVRTDESDDWCPGCEAIVDGEEVLA